MAMYNLYIGLGGSFGGYRYYCTEEYETEEQAYEDAYELAREKYQSYEGLYELPTWKNAKENYCKENNLTEDQLNDDDYEYIDADYDEAVDRWLSVLVTTVEEDPNHNRGR